jgi:elongation factor Ts
MTHVSVQELKELRRLSGAGVMECREALEATNGHMEQALDRIRRRAAEEAARRADREAGQGIVASYVHHTGRLGALVEVNCETDFVARTADFVALGRQLAEHVAAAAPLAVDTASLPSEIVAARRGEVEAQVRASGKPEALHATIVAGKLAACLRDVVLLQQPWVREPQRTVGDLVHEAAARFGERVQVRRFTRFELGSR